MQTHNLIEVEVENPTVLQRNCCTQVKCRNGKKWTLVYSESVWKDLEAQNNKIEWHYEH